MGCINHNVLLRRTGIQHTDTLPRVLVFCNNIALQLCVEVIEDFLRVLQSVVTEATWRPSGINGHADAVAGFQRSPTRLWKQR